MDVIGLQVNIKLRQQKLSRGFTSCSTARVILAEILSNVTCGSQPHTEVTASD